MVIIGYINTKKLGKQITPYIYMIIFMAENIIIKKRNRTPETYMMIYTTDDIIKKKRWTDFWKGRRYNYIDERIEKVTFMMEKLKLIIIKKLIWKHNTSEKHTIKTVQSI